jgi:photosynthetic reaction center cytochrome c subunit
MRVFNTALGVNCDHCHVWTKPGDPSNDMPADTKATKAVAREMMRMTSDVNTRLAAAIKKSADQLTKVECWTCHRGQAIPATPPPPPAPPAK